jgi:hypothetical protein
MKKNLTKGIQSLLTLILLGAKKALFFTLNTITLKSMWSIFLKFFPQITLNPKGQREPKQLFPNLDKVF